MATRITDTEMTSDTARHKAELVKLPSPLTGYSWHVTWLPGQHLTRDQAVTAMTIAEMVVERADILADSSSKLWWHIDGWAEELGITGPHAVAEASLSPEDHAEMRRVRVIDPEPGPTGVLLSLDPATGMASVRIDGYTIEMEACRLQYAE